MKNSMQIIDKVDLKHFKILFVLFCFMAMTLSTFTNKMNYHQNGCFNLVNHIRERKDIAFVIEVVKDDFQYKTNFAFHQRLNELKIPHIYNETRGGLWNENTLHSLFSNLQYFNKSPFR